MRYFFENTKTELIRFIGDPTKTTPAGESVWEPTSGKIVLKRSHVFCYRVDGDDTRDKVVIGFTVPYDLIDTINHTAKPGDEGLLTFKDGNGFEIGVIKTKRVK